MRIIFPVSSEFVQKQRCCSGYYCNVPERTLYIRVRAQPAQQSLISINRRAQIGMKLVYSHQSLYSQEMVEANIRLRMKLWARGFQLRSTDARCTSQSVVDPLCLFCSAFFLHSKTFFVFFHSREQRTFQRTTLASSSTCLTYSVVWDGCTWKRLFVTV